MTTEVEDLGDMVVVSKATTLTELRAEMMSFPTGVGVPNGHGKLSGGEWSERGACCG